MAKTKIYFKNNQAYFKSGGRFFPLPKAQDGLKDMPYPKATAQDSMDVHNSFNAQRDYFMSQGYVPSSSRSVDADHLQCGGKTMGFGGAVKKYREGGPVDPKKDDQEKMLAMHGWPKPTAQDSLYASQRSKELINYYNNNDNTMSKVFGKDRTLHSQLQELDNDYTDFNKYPDKPVKVPSMGFQPRITTRSNVDYRKEQKNPWIVEQREGNAGLLDTNAPFGYYDLRMAPHGKIRGMNDNPLSSMKGDMFSVPVYDPIALKPYAMRTPDDHAYLDKTYGSSSTTPTPVPQMDYKDTVAGQMQSMGMNPTFANRSKMAEEYGITGYSGSMEQNMKLLDLIKSGGPKTGLEKPVETTISNTNLLTQTPTVAISTPTPIPERKVVIQDNRKPVPGRSQQDLQDLKTIREQGLGLLRGAGSAVPLHPDKQLEFYRAGKLTKMPIASNQLERAYGGYLPKAQTSLDLSNLPMPTITGTQIPTNPVAVQTGAMPPPDSGANNWQQFTNFAKENPTTMAAGTGMLSGIASNFTNKSSNNIDPLIKGQMSGYNNDRGASTANTLLDTAASLDPTGTMKLVNMGVKAGKAVGNLVANKDKYGISQSGAQEAISNVFDPIGFVQDSFNVGKQHGFGQGLKNFATLGVSGRKLQEEAKDDALDRIDYKDMAERAGTNKGNYRNDSVYAKRGVNLSNQTLNNKKKPNVEIEDGEIMLGTPGAVTKYGNASTSLNSKFAAKFHGDEHGEDTDKDGMEGIPLNAPGGYIASNYLGMDGRKVKKQNGGKMGPTVADEMTPLVNYLHEAEQDSQDGYKNNPVAIKQVLRQLENMKNTAEVNKWRREVEKMFKDDSIPIEEILTFIQENAPADDMNPEQLAALQGMMPQGQPQMQSGPQQQPQDQLAQMAQQAEQIQPTAKNGLNMNNRFYNRYQQGGPMMNPQDEQAPNPSSNRMEQLMQQSQQTPPSATNPAMQDMDPEVQQMFAQLPPELQDQIMQMPPEQMEIAIMNAFEQMQGQGQQMPPEGMEGGQEQMDPAAQEQAMMEQAMMAEQQALMQLGGYAGDQYRDKNYSYPNSQSPNSANAHLPRPVLQENFNPATKTHTQPFAAFQDRYQTGGAISNDMVQMVQQLIQQGYSQEQAIEVAKNKLAQESQPEMKHGGMVGKTVRFKSGGKIVQGKIKSYDNNTGNFELY
jgi:hypothetical protein